MPNIIDILARALSLRQETELNSITPNRAGGIMYDTLLVLNQMQLEGGSLLISKVYSSVAAMEADTTPTSDLTGRALKPGQLVVIVTSNSSSSDMGSEYRFNGPGSWTYVGKVGGLPLDTVPTQSSTKGITSGGVYTALAAMKAEGYKYMGLATPGSGGTAPGTPNQPVFYIAGPGSYPNFGSITVASGYLGFIKYSGGSWSVESVAVGKDYDQEISQLRSKVSELDADINGGTQEETTEQPLTANGYFNTSNDPLNYDAAPLDGNYCCRLPVFPGEKYRITGNGSGTIYVLLYATADSDNVPIRKASTDIDYRITPAEITIQPGEAYLYVNLYDYNSQTDKVEKVTDVLVGGLKADVQTLTEQIANIQVQDKEQLVFQPGVYVDLSGGVGTIAPSPELSYTHDYCRRTVNEGDKVILNGIGGTTERLWAFVDKENRILSVASPNATGTDLEIVAPANSVAVIVNSSDTSVPSYYVSAVNVAGRITDNMIGVKDNAEKIAIVRSNTESRETLGYSKQMDEYVIDRVGVVSPVPGYNAFVRYFYVSGQKIVHISFESPLTQSGVFCAYAIYASDVPGTSPIAYGHRLVSSYEMDVIIPEGGRYIGVQLNIYYDTLSVYGFTLLIKSLTGKRVVCFGDSLTEFWGAYDDKTYSQHLADITGADVINVGIGGTRLGCRTSPVLNPTNAMEGYAALDCPSLIDAVATQDFTIVDAGALWVKNNESDDNTPIIARLKAIDWAKVDVVTFFLGTNDWNGWEAFGNPGDVSKLSVLGAVNYIIQTLLTAYPHLTIFWFTPIVIWLASNLSERTDANWGGVYEVDGRTLEEFSDGIYNEVRNNSIPVCDMYHTLGWNKFNFSQYFLDTDGVHPYKGFRNIASKIASFIYGNRNF